MSKTAELLGFDPSVLLERRSSGFFVQISYSPTGDVCLLECETQNDSRVVEIPGDKVLDAFEHPCIYIENPNDLFTSPPEKVDTKPKKSVYDHEKDYSPHGYPFGKGKTNCECCGKAWESGEAATMIYAVEFLAYLNYGLEIPRKQLQDVEKSLGNQTEMIVCKRCMNQIYNEDIPF